MACVFNFIIASSKLIEKVYLWTKAGSGRWYAVKSGMKQTKGINLHTQPSR